MNDLDLCLEVVSRSCQPLRYIWRWISRKPFEIEAWFQRTTNRKWHMDYWIVTWTMTSRDPNRCCEQVRSAILATAWLLVLPGIMIEHCVEALTNGGELSVLYTQSATTAEFRKYRHISDTAWPGSYRQAETRGKWVRPRQPLYNVEVLSAWSRVARLHSRRRVR